MQVNTEKTKIVVFRKRGDLRDNESWIYKYTPIEVVNEFNYLGTVFKYTGSFVLNQETLVGKGLKTLNCLFYITKIYSGAQWLSGRVLDSRPKGRGFEPHRRHCVVVLEQDTFILA